MKPLFQLQHAGLGNMHMPANARYLSRRLGFLIFRALGMVFLTAVA